MSRTSFKFLRRLTAMLASTAILSTVGVFARDEKEVIATSSNSRLQMSLVDDGIILFDGEIEPFSAKRMAALIRDSENRGHLVSVVVVRSPGGATEEGLEIGNLIRDRGLSVIVYDYCLSSCANYFATATRKLIVPDGAFVGFHGGARQSEDELDKLFDPNAPGYSISESDGAAQREHKRSAKEIVAQRRSKVADEGRREAAFLESVGLPTDFLQKTGGESGISSLETFIVFDRDTLENCYGFSNLHLYPSYGEESYKIGSNKMGPTLVIVRRCLQ